MWVSRSFDSVGSRARAVFGKLRGAFAGRIDDDYEDEPLAIEAPRGLDRNDFEAVRVGDSADSPEVFVAKPTEAAYFEIEEAYAPTLVGASRMDARVDDIVEPRSRREKAAAGEPADLFINALRRPVHQKFDSSAPVFKKKAEAAPVSAPATEVEPVVEQIVFGAEDVAEQTEVVVVPEVTAEEVETVIDETVIEAPVAEVPAAETPAVEVAAEENLEIPVINIPVTEASVEEPVTEASVEELPAVEAEPEIEVAPVAEPIMALPAPVEAAAEEEYDFSMFDNLETDDSRVEYEISHDVGKEETFAVEAPVAEAAAEENLEIPVINIPVAAAVAEEPAVEAVEELPAVEAEPVVEDNTVFDVASLVAVEPAVTEAPVAEAAEEENLEIPVTAAVAEEPAVEAPIAEESAVEAEPVREEAEPVRVLPAKVVLSLPQKIEIPALERSAPEQDVVSGYTADEMAETSVAVKEEKASETETIGEVKAQLPPIILNEDRDVLFAFRGELESDEFEFINTSYDDNLAFREDYLDETERTFKIRAKIERPRFNGDLRSLAYY